MLNIKTRCRTLRNGSKGLPLPTFLAHWLYVDLQISLRCESIRATKITAVSRYRGSETQLTILSSRNALGKQRAYGSNVLGRESVLCPGVGILLRNMIQNLFQNLPVALGKCRPEARGCVSTRKAQIDRSSHQEDLTRRCEAMVVPRLPSRV